MTTFPKSLIRPMRVASSFRAVLLALALTPVFLGAAESPSAAVSVFDDDARPLAGWDAAVVAAGTDAVKLEHLAQQLLAVVQSADATAAARQDAAEHLGHVIVIAPAKTDAAALAGLAPLLANDANFELARLSLDRVPGKDVDALYLKAVEKAQGRTRVALIQSIGARSVAAAVPVLHKMLDDADGAVAQAAVHALGRIGGPAALAALGAAKEPLSPAVLNARLAAAAKAGAATAARTTEEIYRNPAAPMPQRSAALRGLIAAKREKALDLVDEVLKGSEPAFHQVALESVATLPAANASAKLAGNLGSYAPPVQVALIAALASRGDAGAIPGLLATLKSPDADVRLADIDCLGRLPGNSTVAGALANIAAGSGAEAKAAGESLARLNGPGVDEFVRNGAAKGEAKLREVYIQQIAARNLVDAVPFLLGLRAAPEQDLRLEALDALRAIAPPSQQPAVIAWAVGAAKQNEQNRAVRALITMILRDDAVETRASPVVDAMLLRDEIGGAGAKAVASGAQGDGHARLILLPVLSRVGGGQALAAAADLARGGDESVANAAVAELARWPDISALPVLVDVAAKTSQADLRATIVRGAVHFLERRNDVPPDLRANYARTLIDLPLAAPEQNTLLRVLSLCEDQHALEIAKRFVANPATAVEAQDAVDAITSNLAGPPDFKAASAVADLANLSDGSVNTIWLVPNTPDQWLFADLKHTRPIHRITLVSGRGRGWGYPAQADVYVSDDPEQQGDVRAHVEGQEDGPTIITLPGGVHGRYVWIRQTGTRDAPWVIAEFQVE